MKPHRISIFALMSVSVTIVGTASVAYGAQMTICHITDPAEREGVVKRISGSNWQKHKAHGDCLTDEDDEVGEDCFCDNDD